MRKLFLSHRLDLLADHLAEELHQEEEDVFTPCFTLVPNPFLKQWLGIELTKRSQGGGIANYKIMTLQEGIRTFFPCSEFTEIVLSLYQTLASFDDPEVSSYVKDSSQKRTELSIELGDLLLRYGYSYPSLFQDDPECQNWQKKLIQSLFVKGALHAPFQAPSPTLPLLRCFGFDFLPEPVWKAMQFHSVYLFSPCRFFWEDLCSNRERKHLLHFFEKKGVSLNQREELDSYLREAPPLLANFGKLGRETLKILDSLDYQMIEDYGFVDEEASALQRLQKRLLNFEIGAFEKQPEDSSVQLSKEGSSLLKEIEHLRNSILQLIQEKGLLFSEIAVLAPDIQPYVPFIQFVFADLPFRIFDVEIGSKSPFYQGLKKLCHLEWTQEDLIRLFENPSFCHARNWDENMLQWLRETLSDGIDSDFEKILLQRFVFLSPDDPHRIATPSSEMLSECIEVLLSLRDDLVIRSKSHSLKEWADFLKSLVEKHLKVDSSNEADIAASKFFEKTMRELIRLSSDDTLFPFAPIEALLKREAFTGQIHSSSLHAIRFGSLHEGSLVPVRTLFLIGMDEEHFPRSSFPSSLDLLWQEKKLSFHPSDQDRYLFLKAIFTATQSLHISYAHLALDGRPMNPSYVIEEFLSSLDAPAAEKRSKFFAKQSRSIYFPWQETPSHSLPAGNQIISLSDLASLARHPWSFYLQKKFGIWIESPEEKTFSQEKAKSLRSSFQQEIIFPHGMYGEALKTEVKETQEEWEKALHSWDIKIESAFLKMSCREKRNIETGWEFPPLEVVLTKDLRVQIVGEIKNFCSQGFVHFGRDSIDGLLRVWPECLVTSLITGFTKIYCLQSKSVKELPFPEEAFKAFLLYYFLSLSAPSPLLIDLADSFLRKGNSEWEKKMRDKQSGKGMFFADPVFEWVSQRTTFPPMNQCLSSWEESLRHYFSALSSLYLSREQIS